MLRLYVSPSSVRVEAKVNVVCAGATAADAVTLLALVERKILDLTDELRQLRDERNEICAMAAEAELRFVRAADHYHAVHVEAVPWSQMASDAELDQAAE